MTKDKQKIKAQRRRYYIKHREREIEMASKWDRANPAVRNATRKEYRAKLKSQVHSKLGNKCAKCPENDPVVLQIDHVFNDGKQDDIKFQNRSAPAYLKNVLSDTQGRYQLLCANCNLKKYYIGRG
jgi:hypothetical protein